MSSPVWPVFLLFLPLPTHTREASWGAGSFLVSCPIVEQEARASFNWSF